MNLFATEDIENADDDPFGFPKGRHEATITFSGEATVGKNDEYRVWKITFHSEKLKKDHDLIIFLDSQDAEQAARNNGNIKRILKALEIPQSRWGQVSENPEELVGIDAVVNVVSNKAGDRKYLNVVGVAQGTPPPVSFNGNRMTDQEIKAAKATAPTETAGANPFGF